MVVHKAKPVRSWRALVDEVGVIVLGVLIALGAGQAVEALQWRDKVSSAREAMRAELHENAGYAYERVGLGACEEAQLQGLQAKLLTNTTAWKAVAGPYPDHAVYREPIRPWPSAAWEAAIASTALAHMPRDEMLKFAGAYQAVRLLQPANVKEAYEANDLRMLSRDQVLNDVSRDRLLAKVQGASGDNQLLSLVSSQFLDNAAALGVRLSVKDKTAARDAGKAFYPGCVLPAGA